MKQEPEMGDVGLVRLASQVRRATKDRWPPRHQCIHGTTPQLISTSTPNAAQGRALLSTHPNPFGSQLVGRCQRLGIMRQSIDLAVRDYRNAPYGVQMGPAKLLPYLASYFLLHISHLWAFVRRPGCLSLLLSIPLRLIVAQLNSSRALALPLGRPSSIWISTKALTRS